MKGKKGQRATTNYEYSANKSSKHLINHDNNHHETYKICSVQPLIVFLPLIEKLAAWCAECAVLWTHNSIHITIDCQILVGKGCPKKKLPQNFCLSSNIRGIIYWINMTIWRKIFEKGFWLFSDTLYHKWIPGNVGVIGRLVLCEMLEYNQTESGSLFPS